MLRPFNARKILAQVRLFLGVSVFVAWVGQGHAGQLPACAEPVAAKTVRTARVAKNGDLRLADGRTVRLEGLLLPTGGGDRAPGSFASEAVETLDGLAKGRISTLSLFPPKDDRYGRLRAQIFVAQDGREVWLQIAMLKRGLARVSMSPDRHECASELYAAEAYARREHAGIWASGYYDVRAPDELEGRIGTFQIVQGEVMSARVHGGTAYLDFGRNWREDFKATISAEDMRRFRDTGVDPRNYQGLTVRVRGYVEWYRGPEIEVASPQMIEVVSGS